MKNYLRKKLINLFYKHRTQAILRLTSEVFLKEHYFL